MVIDGHLEWFLQTAVLNGCPHVGHFPGVGATTELHPPRLRYGY